MTSFYLLSAANQPTGPHTREEVLLMIRTGRASWKTLATLAGDEEWLPLSTWADTLQRAGRSAGGPVAITGTAREAKLPRQMGRAAKSLGLVAVLFGAAGMMAENVVFVIVAAVVLAAALISGVLARSLRE